METNKIPLNSHQSGNETCTCTLHSVVYLQPAVPCSHKVRQRRSTSLILFQKAIHPWNLECFFPPCNQICQVKCNIIQLFKAPHLNNEP